jgi:hypothetical protein
MPVGVFVGGDELPPGEGGGVVCTAVGTNVVGE